MSIEEFVKEIERMKDRYLYKAKRKDNGEWVTGSLITYKDGTCKIVTNCLEGNIAILVSAYDVDKDTICQCTGLKDKKDKLIWENDIIECRLGKVIVHWDDTEWKLKNHDAFIWYKDLYYWVISDRKAEVIGNIFDNPELNPELLESEE